MSNVAEEGSREGVKSIFDETTVERISALLRGTLEDIEGSEHNGKWRIKHPNYVLAINRDEQGREEVVYASRHPTSGISFQVGMENVTGFTTDKGQHAVYFWKDIDSAKESLISVDDMGNFQFEGSGIAIRLRS